MPGRKPLVLAVLIACAMFIAAGSLFPAFAEPVYKTLPESKVNQAEKASIEKIAEGLLSDWSKGKFEPLAETFTAKMVKALPPDAQKAAYAKIKETFGDFKSMTFAEAGTTSKIPNAVVYRFKGTFSKAKTPPEIRVVVNNKGKIEGFFVLKWNAGI